MSSHLPNTKLIEKKLDEMRSSILQRIERLLKLYLFGIVQSTFCNVIRIFIHSLNYFFQILVERDDVSWDTREWLNVYKDNYQLLAVEHKLVLANRSGGRDQGNLWPALVSHILTYLWQILVKKVRFAQVWIFFVILLSTQSNSWLGGWRNWFFLTFPACF